MGKGARAPKMAESAWFLISKDVDPSGRRRFRRTIDPGGLKKLGLLESCLLGSKALKN